MRELGAVDTKLWLAAIARVGAGTDVFVAAAVHFGFGFHLRVADSKRRNSGRLDHGI